MSQEPTDDKKEPSAPPEQKHAHAHDTSSSRILDKREKFAEDLVYTLNHAIVCATSDVLDPFIGTWTQQYLGKHVVLNPLHAWAHKKFEHHDHDHHHHGKHGKHGGGDHHHHNESFVKNLGHWVVGEAVGDVGAVPFTLGMQYYTPGIMRSIQHLTEPVLGPVFRGSANRYSRHWARENGFAENSPEAKARADELYKHEVEHLPHAFMWTGSAAALNVLTQKYVTRNKAPTKHIIAGKALGSFGTLSLVLLLRSLAPGKIKQLDEWNAKNLGEPLTRRIGGWFGIDSDTVTRVLEREREFEDGHHILEQAKKHDSENKHDKDGDSHHPSKHIESENATLSKPLHFSRLIG